MIMNLQELSKPVLLTGKIFFNKSFNKSENKNIAFQIDVRAFLHVIIVSKAYKG